MLYTVSEISDMLEFSKVTIYNKINSLKTDLRPYIVHKKGVMHIKEKGVLIIKKDLGLINDENISKYNDNLRAENEVDNNGSGQFKEFNTLIKTLEKTIKTSQEDYIQSLLDQIDLLKSELNKKDDKLNNTLKLLENSQVLIKDKKEKILMLENEEEKKGFLNWFRK